MKKVMYILLATAGAVSLSQCVTERVKHDRHHRHGGTTTTTTTEETTMIRPSTRTMEMQTTRSY